MGKQLEAFRTLQDLTGIAFACNDSLRCTAVRLEDGNLCLFSPVKGLGATAHESLQEMGSVKYLLAPNHYHNRALREYAGVFPKAVLCASVEARPRLQKVTSLEFSNLTELKRKLPENIEMMATDGLKTGEVWLRIRQDREICWVVVDAFCGPSKTAVDSVAATPELLKTFPRYALKDQVRYTNWINAQIDKDQPTTLIPCHGSIVRSKQLPKKLRSLVSAHAKLKM